MQFGEYKRRDGYHGYGEYVKALLLSEHVVGVLLKCWMGPPLLKKDTFLRERKFLQGILALIASAPTASAT